MNLPYLHHLDAIDRASSFSLMRAAAKRVQVEEPPEALLADAYERLKGHPYFLRLLIALARSFPLDQLLRSLPPFAEKAQAYIREQVIAHLTPHATTLLAHLSLLRLPFTSDAITSASEDEWESFNSLLDRFLVTPSKSERSRYEIHNIIRATCVARLAPDTLIEGHRRALSYYRTSMRRFVDLREAVYHAFESGSLSDAADVSRTLLAGALHTGVFDVVIEFSEELTANAHASKWSFVHYQRGRALRFKERFDDALKAYEDALRCAASTEEKEFASYEIASVLVKCSVNPRSKGWKRAISIYKALVRSENVERRISALSTLGGLDVRSGARARGLHQLEQALELAERHKLHREIAEVCFGLGVAHARTAPKRAIQLLERSMDVRMQATDQVGAQDWEAVYHTANWLADLYCRVGQYEKAVDCNQVRVDIDRKINVEARLAHSLFALGSGQCLVGSFEDAKKSLEESLSLVQKNDIKQHAESANLRYLVVALWNLGHHQNAIERLAEYRHVCKKEGTEGAPFSFVLERECKPAVLPDSPEVSIQILRVPEPFTGSDLKQWVQRTIEVHPEFGEGWVQFGNMFQ